MNFDPAVLLTFGILCLIGIITNLAAFLYVTKALKGVQTSLHFLLMADSLTSLLGIVTYLGITVAVYKNVNNEIMCSLWFISFHTPSLIGAVATAQIAIIRYSCLVLSAKMKKPDDWKLLILNVFIVVFILFLAFLVAGLHLSNGLPLAIIPEKCYNGLHPRHIHVMSKVYAILPQVLGLMISILFSYMIVRVLKKNAFSRNYHIQKNFPEANKILADPSINSSSYLSIPIKATICSALILIPYIIIGIAISIESTILGPEASTIIGVISLLMNGIRFPISALVTFSRKK